MPSKNAWLLVPRFIQFILTAAVFALALYVGIMFGYSSVMIYTLFTSIWTGVIAIPSFSLAPTCCPNLGRSYITPALELITMLLWLAQFIAMAVLIPSSDNSGFDGWLSATVLGAVEWLAYVVTTVRSIMDATQK